ncbi:IS3 family transposase [Clostridium perfringens]|nr:IS3 family transposase [Clostridium perfringens]
MSKKAVRIQKGVINVRDKFFIIRELSCKYTVKLLCNIAAVSRSGYYKWLNKGKKDISYSELENKILELYNKFKKVYGYKRIKVALLREFGIRVNHKKVLRLMRKINIKSVIRKKKFKYKKLKIEYCSTKENILNRNFKAEKINEKWATDITARKRLIYQLLKIYLTMKLLHIRSVNI